MSLGAARPIRAPPGICPLGGSPLYSLKGGELMSEETTKGFPYMVEIVDMLRGRSDPRRTIWRIHEALNREGVTDGDAWADSVSDPWECVEVERHYEQRRAAESAREYDEIVNHAAKTTAFIEVVNRELEAAGFEPNYTVSRDDLPF
jgi:hypothetical protein